MGERSCGRESWESYVQNQINGGVIRRHVDQIVKSSLSPNMEREKFYDLETPALVPEVDRPIIPPMPEVLDQPDQPANESGGNSTPTVNSPPTMVVPEVISEHPETLRRSSRVRRRPTKLDDYSPQLWGDY